MVISCSKVLGSAVSSVSHHDPKADQVILGHMKLCGHWCQICPFVQKMQFTCSAISYSSFSHHWAIRLLEEGKLKYDTVVTVCAQP